MMVVMRRKQIMWNDNFYGSEFALHNSLYGNYRTRTFTQIWGTVDEFLQDYNDNGIIASISDTSATTLYYLLYSRYGNSNIASSDETQFKYKVFSTIFSYGPTWEKRLEVQKALREMDLDELRESAKAMYNHSFNPSTAPKTDVDGDEWKASVLSTINDQNVTIHKRSKTDAYALLLSLLETDVTTEFIDRFKKLFLTIVEPELPLWYVTGIEGGLL